MEEATNYITDYVANWSFASLASNVKYLNQESFAVLIRLDDYRNNFKWPFVYIDEHAYNFLSKSRLYGWETIISNIWENVGTVFRCPRLSKKMSLAPNSIMMTFKWDDDFYYYWLIWPVWQRTLKNIVTWSSQPKFNKTNLRELIVPNPPIEEQQKIAKVLLTIDNKIELNNKINSELEAMVRELYEYRFILHDFR